MTSLTTEQLAELTERLNQRIEEFDVVALPTITAGIMRLAYEVIAEWRIEGMSELIRPSYATGTPDHNLLRIHTNGLAELANAWPTLPDLDGVDLFAEHGEPTGAPSPAPCLAESQEECDALIAAAGDAAREAVETIAVRQFQSQPAPATNGRLAAALKKPRTLAEVDRAAQLKADLEAIIAFIRDLSVHGRMPSQLEYQVKRPKHLPSWITITKRYEVVTWRQMAELCGLDYDAAQLSHARIVEVEDDPCMPDGLDDADDDADLLDDDDFDDSDDAPAKRKKPAGKREKRERLTRSQEFSRPGPEPKHSVTQPTLEQLITELQRQAMGNVMVTQAAFNLAKPAVWGSATAQVTRFGLSWEQLREEAGLKPNPRWARTWQQADAAA